MAVSEAKPAPPPASGLIASTLVRKFLKDNDLRSALKKLEAGLLQKGWPLGDPDTLQDAVGVDSLEQLVTKIEKDVRDSSVPQSVEPEIEQVTKVAKVKADAHPCKWDSCRKRFSTTQDLYDHVSEKHVGRKVGGHRTLKCHWDGCSYSPTSNKRDHLTSHIQTHISLKPFQCRYCGARSRKSSDNTKHEAVCDKGPAKAQAPATSLKRKLPDGPSQDAPQSTSSKKVRPAPEAEPNGTKEISKTPKSEPAPASDSDTSSSSSSDDSTFSEESDEEQKSAPANLPRSEKMSNNPVKLEDTPSAPKLERFEVTPKKKKHVGARPTPLAQLSTQATPYSHISNEYQSYEYAERAYKDLSVTRGKGFTKEKNKKKRGSYRGGPIDTSGGKAYKFED